MTTICPSCGRTVADRAACMECKEDVMEPCFFCGSPDGCDCLERMECKDQGKLGHQHCGICPDHGTPRFKCFNRPHPAPRASVMPPNVKAIDPLFIHGVFNEFSPDEKALMEKAELPHILRTKGAI